MPDITHQSKHTPTAVYCGRVCRIVSFMTDEHGREYVRLEFSDHTQLTVEKSQITVNN